MFSGEAGITLFACGANLSGNDCATSLSAFRLAKRRDEDPVSDFLATSLSMTCLTDESSSGTSAANARTANLAWVYGASAGESGALSFGFRVWIHVCLQFRFTFGFGPGFGLSSEVSSESSLGTMVNFVHFKISYINCWCCTFG